MVQNWSKEKRKRRVLEMLDAVGMADQGDKYPSQISGGQKQRVRVSLSSIRDFGYDTEKQEEEPTESESEEETDEETSEEETESGDETEEG